MGGKESLSHSPERTQLQQTSKIEKGGKGAQAPSEDDDSDILARPAWWEPHNLHWETLLQRGKEVGDRREGDRLRVNISSPPYRGEETLFLPYQK